MANISFAGFKIIHPKYYEHLKKSSFGFRDFARVIFSKTFIKKSLLWTLLKIKYADKKT